MSEPPETRLQRLLGGDRLAGLRKRLRRRFEHAHPGLLEHVRIDGLTADEHAVLASLTGRPQRFAASMRIALSLVDASFRDAGIAASLRDALECLDGPILDVAATRLRLRDQWSQVVTSCRDPALSAMLGDSSGLGLLRRLARQDAARAAELCRRAEDVLRRLPAHGITRSQLAAEVLGDAHALDTGRPVSTLVLATRRLLAGSARKESKAVTEQDDDADAPHVADRARELWATAGVLVNELARPALFLNLPVKGIDAAENGDPRYASLRSLCFDVLAVGEPEENGEEKIAEWEHTSASRVERARRTLMEIYQSGQRDLATLSVAARQIRSMTRTSGRGAAG